MEPIAAGLTRDQHRTLARYFAALPAGPPPGLASASAVERGRQIATDGIPDRLVPSCIDCHGPGQTPRNPAYPLLAGQYASYLTLQLELFKHGQRGGSPFAGLMAPAVHRLTPEQMSDVAAYYQSLPANATAQDPEPHAERNE
jgi:cytochrome c553